MFRSIIYLVLFIFTQSFSNIQFLLKITNYELRITNYEIGTIERTNFERTNFERTNFERIN